MKTLPKKRLMHNKKTVDDLKPAADQATAAQNTAKIGRAHV